MSLGHEMDRRSFLSLSMLASAGVLIAAPDSPSWWRSEADILDPLEGDISQALADSVAVVLAPGSFVEDVSFSTNRVLTGAGWGTELFGSVTGNGDFLRLRSLTVRDSLGDGVSISGDKNKVEDVAVFDAAGDGVTSIDGTGAWVSDCYVIRSGGSNYRLESHDSFLMGSRGGRCGLDGVVNAGGNNRISDTKQFYADRDGFAVIGARASLSNVEAQENGRHGFTIHSRDYLAQGLYADSNGRLGFGAGVRITTNYSGLCSFVASNSLADQGQDVGIWINDGAMCNVIGSVDARHISSPTVGVPGVGGVMNVVVS